MTIPKSRIEKVLQDVVLENQGYLGASQLEPVGLSLTLGLKELHGTTVSEATPPFSARLFSKSLAANRPVVIRNYGQATRVPALRRWTKEYLQQRLNPSPLTVAVSPAGSVNNSGSFTEALFY
jgi:hypothetical protein